MNELVRAVANQTGETISGTGSIIGATFSVIQDTLASGENVKLVGFGQFMIKKRAARLCRNPKKNVPVHIPAIRKPVFTPGKSMRDAVTGNCLTENTDELECNLRNR